MEVRRIRIIGTGNVYLPAIESSKVAQQSGPIKTASQLIDDACDQAIKVANLNIDDVACLIAGASLRGKEFAFPASLLHASMKSHSGLDIRMGTVFLEDLRTASYLIDKKEYGYILLVHVELSESGGASANSAALFTKAVCVTAVLIRAAKEQEDSAIFRVETRIFSHPKKKEVSLPTRYRWSQRRSKKDSKDKELAELQENRHLEPPFKLVMSQLMKFIMRLIDDAGAKPIGIGAVIWNRAEFLSFSQLVTNLRVDPNQFADGGSDQVGMNYSLPANLHSALISRRLQREEWMVMLDISERIITGVVMIY